MIRWGGKKDTLILRMLEPQDEGDFGPNWPYNIQKDPFDFTNTNPPPTQDDTFDDVPVESNPVPDSEEPPVSADLPEVVEYEPERFKSSLEESKERSAVLCGV